MKYLAIDIGGTFIKYALINDAAEILEKSNVKTPIKEDNTIDDLKNILLSIYDKYKDKVAGVAISMPGILDSDTGYLYTGGAIGYTSQQNIISILEDKIDVPITVENDGKCAALAELWCGGLSKVKNGAVVILGTGVGGGIIIDRKLYKGSNFSAGEFSYVADSYENANDTTGYWGMISSVGTLIELAANEIGIDKEELDGLKVFEMANNKDERVLKALDIYTKNLTINIYNLQVLLDLDLIAIGGGISQQPILIEYLQKNIDEYVNNHPLKIIGPFIPKPVITTCKFFNDSNLIGALYHHLKNNEIVKAY